MINNKATSIFFEPHLITQAAKALSYLFKLNISYASDGFALQLFKYNDLIKPVQKLGSELFVQGFLYDAFVSGCTRVFYGFGGESNSLSELFYLLGTHI